MSGRNRNVGPRSKCRIEIEMLDLDFLPPFPILILFSHYDSHHGSWILYLGYKDPGYKDLDPGYKDLDPGN